MPESRRLKCHKCDRSFEIAPTADTAKCPNCSKVFRRSNKANQRPKTSRSSEPIPVAEFIPDGSIVVVNSEEPTTGSALLEQIGQASVTVDMGLQKPRKRWLVTVLVLGVLVSSTAGTLWWIVRKPTGLPKSPRESKTTIAAVPDAKSSTLKPKEAPRSQSVTDTSDEDKTPTKPREEQPSEVDLQQRLANLRATLSQRQNELADAKREFASMVDR